MRRRCSSQEFSVSISNCDNARGAKHSAWSPRPKVRHDIITTSGWPRAVFVASCSSEVSSVLLFALKLAQQIKQVSKVTLLTYSSFALVPTQVDSTRFLRVFEQVVLPATRFFFQDLLGGFSKQFEANRKCYINRPHGTDCLVSGVIPQVMTATPSPKFLKPSNEKNGYTNKQHCGPRV